MGKQLNRWIYAIAVKKLERGRLPLDGETTAVKQAWNTLKEELRIQKIHRVSLQKAAVYSGTDLRLNIGCGPNIKAGWINIDISETADLQLDLREPFPFLDNSVALIYSEHFFEHLEYRTEVRNFLAEARRILKPGGRISTGVPDTAGPLKAYVNNEDEYFRISKEKWHPSWCRTRMDSINYHFRQGNEHKYAYDFETMAQTLTDAGFTDITQRDFDPQLDSETRRYGTLYVDAIKPV